MSLRRGHSIVAESPPLLLSDKTPLNQPSHPPRSEHRTVTPSERGVAQKIKDSDIAGNKREDLTGLRSVLTERVRIAQSGRISPACVDTKTQTEVIQTSLETTRNLYQRDD